VTVFGVDLQSAIDGLDFGEGIVIEAVESRDAASARVRLSVSPSAKIGQRDLYSSGDVLENAVVVHDGVDRIEVAPEAGIARVGGTVYPKGFQIYEAIGYDDGPDQEANTTDDLALGRVTATWALEEYMSSTEDDDIEFVGGMLPDGTFEPALDGPNPNRSGNRNNVGDAWVIATHVSTTGETLSARAHLVVTVPLYVRFNPWSEPSPAAGPPTLEDR
jgi:quinohemoprotein amine dehydrogenase